MPAQSPTLSPTLSAMTAGLRGSSSGMPASTLPTRSAPTSAALVKMPPPRRAKTEMSEPPKPRPTSAAVGAIPIETRIAMIDTDRMPSPTTNRPVTLPASKATLSALGRPPRAASAVRTFARTEIPMPMNPAEADAAPPRMKPTAVQMPKPGTPKNPGIASAMAITTATIATTRYCLPMYAIAPSWIAPAISCIFSLPAGNLLILMIRKPA